MKSIVIQAQVITTEGRLRQQSFVFKFAGKAPRNAASVYREVLCRRLPDGVARIGNCAAYIGDRLIDEVRPDRF